MYLWLRPQPAQLAYYLFIFLLFSAAIVVSVWIWHARAEHTGVGRYGFMSWILFLAWISLLTMEVAYALDGLPLLIRGIYQDTHYFLPVSESQTFGARASGQISFS